MARSKNLVTHGFSGKVDHLVFRQLNGKTVISKFPKRRAAFSAAQQASVSTFKQAIIYAKAILVDDAMKLAYGAKALPGQSANNVAIRDFFNPPVIGEIDLSNYSGHPGDTIRIQATDDFKVVAVKVRIERQDSSMTEEGKAVLQEDNLHWVYTARQSIFPKEGTTITITAIDMPGNVTTRQIIV